MQKIKDWIIEKLGGATRKTYESWVKAVGYYYGKYSEEHDNYIALLDAHNAMAEHQKVVDVIDMAKALKAYCAERDDCVGCELHRTVHCKLDAHCPEYWEVENERL